MSLALVGDIGGTHARFALWRDGRLEMPQVLETARFAGPEEAILDYLVGQGLEPLALEQVCLACAGPVESDPFRFTNNRWQISRAAFLSRLGLRQLLLINDFVAMALGVTRLPESELLPVCAGQGEAGRPCLVIGPGTGLGVSALLPDGTGGWRALPGEGGHVDLPLGTDREVALWQEMRRELGHVSAESVLSGAGLLRLYRVGCRLDGLASELESAAAVSRAALAGDAPAAVALEQFCCWLGRVAGNHLLTLGARGGVYLAGGMLPCFPGFLQASGFARCFADKGVMSRYLDGIPVWLVTAEQPGLLGAGLALEMGLL